MPKLVNRYVVWGRTEATEGVPVSLTTADAILVVDKPDVTTDYTLDGSRGHPTLPRIPKGGRFHTVSLVHEVAGGSIAYSATQLPSPHTLLRVCGFDATVDTTAGAEKVTYAPSVPVNAGGGGYTSGSFDVYHRGQRWRMTGTHGQFELAFENGGLAKLTAALSGVSVALPVDANVPALTFPASQLADPAKADGFNLQIGSFAPARVKTLSLKQERDIKPRMMENAAARHGGFSPGGQPTYTLEALVESEALAAYNPYQVTELCQRAALSFAIGTGALYRGFRVEAPNAQLVGTAEQDEENTAAWSFTFELKPTAYMGSDELKIVFPR